MVRGTAGRATDSQQGQTTGKKNLQGFQHNLKRASTRASVGCGPDLQGEGAPTHRPGFLHKGNPRKFLHCSFASCKEGSWKVSNQAAAGRVYSFAPVEGGRRSGWRKQGGPGLSDSNTSSCLGHEVGPARTSDEDQ
eukprot:420701-Pelagomonas_calceolata.AAC.1